MKVLEKAKNQIKRIEDRMAELLHEGKQIADKYKRIQEALKELDAERIEWQDAINEQAPPSEGESTDLNKELNGG